PGGLGQRRFLAHAKRAALERAQAASDRAEVHRLRLGRELGDGLAHAYRRIRLRGHHLHNEVRHGPASLLGGCNDSTHAASPNQPAEVGAPARREHSATAGGAVPVMLDGAPPPAPVAFGRAYLQTVERAAAQAGTQWVGRSYSRGFWVP